MSDPQLQQHDLLPRAAQAVVAAAQVQPGDTVLEIGPGLGALTAAILESGASVTAVERDPARVAHLHTRFATAIEAGRLTVLDGDALRLRPALPPGWRVLANPPFNLTAALLRTWLLETWPGGPPRAIDLVLQREAARKLCAAPGAETRSSVLVRLAGNARLAAHLNRTDVEPPSRVDLAVWSLRRIGSAPDPAELTAIDGVLDRAFAGPHTVRDALRGVATVVQIKRQARERGWNPESHPRLLAPDDWRSLTAVLAKSGMLKP